MKLYSKIIKKLFKLISFISPKLGGKSAFKLFQRVRKKDIRKREAAFYNKARHFKIPFLKEDLNCYELGSADGALIFLVHGWDSNAGSLSKFAFELDKMNYRVISFDLPAHTHSKSKYSNLYECKEAFKTLLDLVQPTTPFSIISHSFGSGVVSYALAETNYKIDKLVFLTSPNYFKDIFTEFKNFIELGDKAFKYMVRLADHLLGERLEDLSVEDKLQYANYGQLLLIHDIHDKILPYKNSEKVSQSVHRAALKTYEKVGHYRMLWNDDVLEETLAFIKN